MDITPVSERRKTRQIMVGRVPVGGDAPITVQSMTTTKTSDVEGTLQQIYALAEEDDRPTQRLYDRVKELLTRIL